jgi:hypothetical protein
MFSGNSVVHCLAHAVEVVVDIIIAQELPIVRTGVAARRMDYRVLCKRIERTKLALQPVNQHEYHTY